MAMAFTELKQEGLYRENRAVTMVGKKKDGRPQQKQAVGVLNLDDN